MLLNSTIVNDRRKKILKACKKDNKILLIATQSVEADVDIDFDIGFRAYAPLDSIIQVAGRINRNSSKELCELIVFDDESSDNIYKEGNRSQYTKENRNSFFDKKDFDEKNIIDEFYKEIINTIDKDNRTPFLESSQTNIADIINLFLKQVNKNVHLIKGDTISLYIPYNDEGKKLWKKYESFFENEKSMENAIHIKDMRKKLSPYSINIFNRYTNHGRLRTKLSDEIRFGYYCCDNWQEYYTYEGGLDVDKFTRIIDEREVVFL